MHAVLEVLGILFIIAAIVVGAIFLVFSSLKPGDVP
jgi:hypothetical protein